MHRLSEKNLVEMTAICEECGPTKLRRKSHHRRPSYQCWTVKVIETARRKNRKKLSRQGEVTTGVCEMCGDDALLVLDHDHATEIRRGWLCRDCNLGLGYFRDDIRRLQAAIDYLGGGTKVQKHKKGTHMGPHPCPKTETGPQGLHQMLTRVKLS